jgi:hypothetical protein
MGDWECGYFQVTENYFISGRKQMPIQLEVIFFLDPNGGAMDRIDLYIIFCHATQALAMIHVFMGYKYRIDFIDRDGILCETFTYFFTR